MTFPPGPASMAKLLHKYLALNAVNSYLRLISRLEKELLSMIQHWEAATGKNVTDPELIALKKLCKDKDLFQHLGFGPLIKQQKSISKWLSNAKNKKVFKEKVQEMNEQFERKEKLKAMFSVIIYKADVVHGLILKVIQLLDKISEDEEKSKQIFDGEFYEIDKEIFEIVTHDPAVIELLNKLVTSKNLEPEIASLMLKTTDESSSEMFRVDDCKHCSYSKEMDAEMKVEQAKIFKEKGNEFFKQNQYELADNKYRKIIELLETELSLKGKIEEERKSLLLAGRLNLAMCLLKQNEWIEARNTCNKILEERTDVPKAYYRRGEALMQLKEYYLAINDFQMVIELEPNNTAAKNKVAYCLQEIKAQKNCEKKVYANMFDKFAKIDAKREEHFK
jgi:tetratricopeptide (TPR) repeat protein